MKKSNTISLIIALILTLMLFTGCAGSSGVSTDDSSMGGSYRLLINNPNEKDGNGKIIPDGSQTIYIEITGEGIDEGSPLTASASASQGEIVVNGIPEGVKVATIQALDVDSNILAQRKESFSITIGETTDSGDVPLGVAVKNDGTNVVFEPSQLNIADGDSVTLQNWTDENLDITVRLGGYNLQGISTDQAGLTVFDEQAITPSTSALAGIQQHEEAACTFNLPVSEFTFTITVPSDSYNFQLPLAPVTGYTHNFTVDWGDGSTGNITSWDDTDKVHTYAAAGDYVVKIDGTCPGIDTWDHSGGSATAIKSIDSWGDVGFRQMKLSTCTNLELLPDESGKLSEVTSFEDAFYYCNKLAYIPEGLFKNNTTVTSFSRCFEDCKNLTSVPAGLFDDNTVVTNFDSCFLSCENIASIPANLFDNNTGVTSFRACFSDCYSLTAIPPGLFDYNTDVTSFQECFMFCESLTSIPADLFDNNTAVTTFNACFVYTTGLTGEAPDLWNTHSSADGANCFNGCTGLSNYSSIPSDWK